MESRLRTHTTSDPLSPTFPHFPTPNKQTLKGARGIGARLRPTRSTQQLAVLSMSSPPEACVHGSNRVPCPDSPECTYSRTSRGKGKAHTDAEYITRATPNAVTQSTPRESSSAPSRRMASIPFTLPPRLPMTQPVSPNHPGSPDLRAPIPSSRTSTSITELESFSSSFCAATIAACAAAADSTIQPTKPQLFAALSHSPPRPPPAYIPRSCHHKSNTIPRQLPSNVQSWDASSLTVSADRPDAPLPPIERPTHHPASLTPGHSPSRPHLSTSFTLPARFSVEGVSARLSPAIITRQPQYPILSLPPISPILAPTNDSRHLRSRSLRSVPALPMEGPEDMEPAEHDNAMLDELEEEEDGTVDGEEDAEEETGEVEHPESASEDGESASRPPSSENSRQGYLPTIDTSRLHLPFLDVNTRETNRWDNKTPKPKDHSIGDYFTSKLAEPTSHTPLLNPRPFPAAWSSARTTPAIPTSTPSGALAAAWATSAQRVLPTPTTPALNARASIYHQASRSMNDLSAILRRPPRRTPEVASKTPMSPLRDPPQEADAAAVNTEEPDAQLGPSLKRRLSMPTFGPSSEPPPYPEFRFGVQGPMIQPRDEEGRERLPQYTNDIYLRAVMPRKMEFSAPGVQARDRKWRRTLCILEGTAFRVYKCRPTGSGKGLIGNLWEKTVGVGDIAAESTQASGSSAKPKRESEREREPSRSKLDAADDAQSPVSSPTSSQPPMLSPDRTPSASSSLQSPNEVGGPSSPTSARSRLLPSNFRRKHRASHDEASTPRTSEFGTTPTSSSFSPSPSRHMGPDSSSSTDYGASPSRSPRRPNPNMPDRSGGLASAPLTNGSPPQRAHRMPRMKRRHLWVDDSTVPHPQEQDLLHAYSLNNAESGLGSDYIKRKNVIRVRMEGQQFLLQARDIASVVDWIEGFQAAANIAQDLDERPMPKGPMFPRRRRRRARVQQEVINSLMADT